MSRPIDNLEVKMEPDHPRTDSFDAQYLLSPPPSSVHGLFDSDTTPSPPVVQTQRPSLDYVDSSAETRRFEAQLTKLTLELHEYSKGLTARLEETTKELNGCKKDLDLHKQLQERMIDEAAQLRKQYDEVCTEKERSERVMSKALGAARGRNRKLALAKASLAPLEKQLQDSERQRQADQSEHQRQTAELKQQIATLTNETDKYKSQLQQTTGCVVQAREMVDVYHGTLCILYGTRDDQRKQELMQLIDLVQRQYRLGRPLQRVCEEQIGEQSNATDVTHAAVASVREEAGTELMSMDEDQDSDDEPLVRKIQRQRRRILTSTVSEHMEEDQAAESPKNEDDEGMVLVESAEANISSDEYDGEEYVPW